MSSSSSSNLPPAGGHVFSAAASAIIDAPIDHVWTLLLDFPRYADWNPFVREQTVVDERGTALADQTARVDARLNLQVDMPPRTTSVNLVSAVDHERYRIAWRFAGRAPAWILETERWQALSVVDDGGTPRTLYESREVFSGLAAYLVRWYVGDKVTRGFENTAIALKKRAEAPAA